MKSPLIITLLHISIQIHQVRCFSFQRTLSHSPSCQRTFKIHNEGLLTRRPFSSDGSDSMGEVVETNKDTGTNSDLIDSAKYPIDLPSPILLAGSVFLAIASTGITRKNYILDP